MYVPKAFIQQDLDMIVQFVRQNSFAILFSEVDGKPFATHVPFLIEQHGNEIKLYSHMAKANPHWKALQDKDVLVVFLGPHAYISSAWYEEENTVSTWNYVAVHMYGKVKLIENGEQLFQIIANTEKKYDENKELVVDDDFIQGMMKGIVGFEIAITSFEGKWKLSQNHSVDRQQKVITQLQKSGLSDDQNIALLMQKNIESSGK